MKETKRSKAFQKSLKWDEDWMLSFLKKFAIDDSSIWQKPPTFKRKKKDNRRRKR